MLVPYILGRPFWHPNASFPLATYDGAAQVESLTQKLDIAGKKINEYAQLIASLSAELREYHDIICRSCKEKVFRAGLAKISSPTSTASARQAIAAASTISASIAVVPMSAQDGPSGAGVHSPNSHERNSVMVIPKPQGARFDYSVEYNPEINRSLDLRVAKTFEFLNKVYCAKFSRDGKYLAVGLEEGETHIYDLVTGSKSVLVEGSTIFTPTETTKISADIWGVRFSPDNKFITTGGSNGQITIWEIGRRRIRAIFRHLDLVRCVDVSPDGRFIASGSHDKSVCLWRVRDGLKARQWNGSGFMSVEFSPDGRYVAAGDDHGILSMWDVRNGRLVVKCKIKDGGIAKSMAFTPNGDRIASGGHTVQCWDVSSLRHRITDEFTSQLDRLWEFKGHQDLIAAVSFSSESRWAVSSSYDRDVCIVDARTGDWVCTLKGHVQRVLVADFSPIGHYLISGGRDRLLRLWRYELV